MKIVTSSVSGVLLLRLEEEKSLDYTCAQEVKRDLLAHIDGTSDVVMDMAEIDFIDSAGLGVLVGLYKQVRRAGRRTRFTGVNPAVLHVMQVIKLDRIFDLTPDVEMAIRSLTA